MKIRVSNEESSRNALSIEVPRSVLLPPPNESLLLNDRKDNNKVHTSPLVSVLIESPKMKPTALSLESATASVSVSEAEPTLALAPEPLSMLLPPSNEWFDRKEDPEKVDSKIRRKKESSRNAVSIEPPSKELQPSNKNKTSSKR